MKLLTLVGKSLNTTVYRGYAPASHLAQISEPDVFDQVQNPNGTQRDLKPRHAKQAHQYAEGQVRRSTSHRLWPEVILNVRDTSVVRIGKPDRRNLVEIQILEDRIEKTDGTDPRISRVDGNHRLWFAEGGKTGHKVLAPLDVDIPFCLTVGLSRNEEAAIFRDINATQMKMNTSHLANLGYTLTPSAELRTADLALWISGELATRTDSPFVDMVFLGGKKQKGVSYPLTLYRLREGVAYTLETSKEITKFSTHPNVQYAFLKEFWMATKSAFNDEWANPSIKVQDTTTGKMRARKKYLFFTYSGFLAYSKIAGDVIDQAIMAQRPDSTFMSITLEKLKQKIDWSYDNCNVFAGATSGGKGTADTGYRNMRQCLPPSYSRAKVVKHVARAAAQK